MSFTLSAPRWFGFQMLPGYGAERCVPFFAPVYLQRVHPLKSGKGELEVDYLNPFYAEGVQDFHVKLKVLLRAENYLLARIAGDPPDQGVRAAVLSHIEFNWLAQCCPGLLAAVPPASLGYLYANSISLYLDRVFLHREWEPETGRDLNAEAENDWLIPCALRFDGYLYAQKHGLPDQPYDFTEWLMHAPEAFERGTGFSMAAMFMLQRRLMKEGVDNKTSQAWRRFRDLFLALCEQEVPVEFRGPEHGVWERQFQPRLRLGREIVRATIAAARYGPHLF